MCKFSTCYCLILKKICDIMCLGEKMRRYKTIILGCGASGVMCALSTKEKSLAIIDSASKPAKKLLVTGNGRCNLTNENVNSSFYNTNIDQFLRKFSNRDALSFFENLGLVSYADEEGRVYPFSNSAKSVVDVLTANLSQKADLFLGEKIEKIDYENKKFVIKTTNEEFEAEKLVVSTGGNSEKILNDLKIKYKKFTPSLVALKCAGTKDLNGIKLSNVLVTAKCENEKKSEIGEILFRENGLSGIVIFNLSAIFARKNNFNGEIFVDIMPNVKEKDLQETLKQRLNIVHANADKFFVGMFQNAVANEIFKQAKINTNKKTERLTDAELEKIAYAIKNLHFDVCGSLENNQVFSGGVSLEDLDDNLMSKEMQNLFFAGEVVDVDGVCGGYNLQWAWTSGYIVGKSI